MYYAYRMPRLVTVEGGLEGGLGSTKAGRPTPTLRQICACIRGRSLYVYAGQVPNCVVTGVVTRLQDGWLCRFGMDEILSS